MRKPFYGWIIVGVCFLIGVTVTGAVAIGSICGGLISLLVGPILDRYGPRMVSFWGIVFFSIGLSALMFISTIAVFGAMGSITWGMLAEKIRIQALMAANLFGSGVVFLLLFRGDILHFRICQHPDAAAEIALIESYKLNVSIYLRLSRLSRTGPFTGRIPERQNFMIELLI